MYEPIHTFMLRTPVWPADKFQQLQCAGDLQASLLNVMDDCFLESIAVASPALYKDLPHLKGDLTQRKTQQVVTSVFKYASRMSTRPTPFGLFSGVTVGELGEYTQVHLQSTQHHKKRARPDMEWLLTIIEKLEDMVEGLQYVKVHANPLVLRVGGRLYLSYHTEYGKQTNVKSKREKISIRASEPVLAALDFSKEPVLFADLVGKMAQQYPDVEEKQIRDFILQLLKQEFLISDLRPPLTIKSPFQYILEKIKRNPFYHEIYHDLLEIEQYIKQLNETAVGEGVSIYRKVITEMKRINETQSVLQVDLALAKRKAVLNKKVAEEAANAATILWRIAQTQKGLPHLKRYKNRFLERYGRNREVPILELLSEETGLGPPEEYDAEAKGENEEPRNNEREQTLLQLMQTALLQKSYTVNLDNHTIEKLEPPSMDESDAPLTMELYAEVLANSAEDIDNGDFTLVIAPNPGSGSAGQTFGRFLDMLDDSVRDSLESVHREQSNTQPNIIMADCVYFPSKGRAANVSLAPGLQEYELVLGTNCANDKKQLSLDDIVVGATLDRLYLKSVSLGKEVIITANNMLNFRSAPALYRFLREVSLENFRIWHSFDWGTLRNSPFLPRVQYGRIILSPAKWRLSTELLGVGKEAADEEWEIALKRWKKEWMVPRYVYLGSTDQRILFDLEHPGQRKELMKELKKKGTVLLSHFSMRITGGLKGLARNILLESLFSRLRKKI
ncbi:lantibiotic dehydratase family protein [Polycladomyces sp. WAk]|uniref:Lantibiotic dehydratase family protein n=2 Tax=Polycladomyces zharkentensis TaxID=2807616 RepID=A0ABS2WGW2_9BACL|nr:lantibiotic dehydratase family protein [Polycladomyces sp. WAk]